jgi:hypothetical protein
MSQTIPSKYEDAENKEEFTLEIIGALTYSYECYPEKTVKTFQEKAKKLLNKPELDKSEKEKVEAFVLLCETTLEKGYESKDPDNPGKLYVFDWNGPECEDYVWANQKHYLVEQSKPVLEKMCGDLGVQLYEEISCFLYNEPEKFNEDKEADEKAKDEMLYVGDARKVVMNMTTFLVKKRQSDTTWITKNLEVIKFLCHWLSSETGPSGCERLKNAITMYESEIP